MKSTALIFALFGMMGTSFAMEQDEVCYEPHAEEIIEAAADNDGAKLLDLFKYGFTACTYRDALDAAMSSDSLDTVKILAEHSNPDDNRVSMILRGVISKAISGDQERALRQLLRVICQYMPRISCVHLFAYAYARALEHDNFLLAKSILFDYSPEDRGSILGYAHKKLHRPVDVEFLRSCGIQPLIIQQLVHATQPLEQHVEPAAAAPSEAVAVEAGPATAPRYEEGYAFRSKIILPPAPARVWKHFISANRWQLIGQPKISPEQLESVAHAYAMAIQNNKKTQAVQILFNVPLISLKDVLIYAKRCYETPINGSWLEQNNIASARLIESIIAETTPTQTEVPASATTGAPDWNMEGVD